MANDALAQSGIDIGLSGEVDYDSAYAAVKATERGRWFLTELANRNRRADTDALMAAIERVEAAVRSDVPAKEPAHLPDVGAAAERLADVAFELRERGADAALCDALDAAVREICTACGSDAKTPEAKNGAAPEQSIPEAAGGAIDAESPPSGDAFDMPLQDSAKFAAAAAALGASLTALGEDAQAPNESESTSSVTAAIPPQDYEAVPQPAAAAEREGPRWHIEAPDFVFHRPQREASDREVESSGGPGRPQPLLPGPQLLPSPDEDPAELFEPPKRVAVMPAAAAATPAAKPAPTPLASAVSAAAQAVRAANTAPSSRSPTGPTVRPMPPRPAPISPLAALRALTEEELIALFG